MHMKRKVEGFHETITVAKETVKMHALDTVYLNDVREKAFYFVTMSTSR